MLFLARGRPAPKQDYDHTREGSVDECGIDRCSYLHTEIENDDAGDDDDDPDDEEDEEQEASC